MTKSTSRGRDATTTQDTGGKHVQRRGYDNDNDTLKQVHPTNVNGLALQA